MGQPRDTKVVVGLLACLPLRLAKMCRWQGGTRGLHPWDSAKIVAFWLHAICVSCFCEFLISVLSYTFICTNRKEPITLASCRIAPVRRSSFGPELYRKHMTRVCHFLFRVEGVGGGGRGPASLARSEGVLYLSWVAMIFQSMYFVKNLRVSPLPSTGGLCCFSLVHGKPKILKYSVPFQIYLCALGLPSVLFLPFRSVGMPSFLYV